MSATEVSFEDKLYGKYEYLDHTADVQIHAWGDNLKEAFENCALGMYGYMTDLGTVDIQDECTQVVEVEADNIYTLLYKFLDECLFIFSAETFLICKKIEIELFDLESFKIKAKLYGETFNLDKHPQGTEVKAITFSNMQIHEKDIYVIIDI